MPARRLLLGARDHGRFACGLGLHQLFLFAVVGALGLLAANRFVRAADQFDLTPNAAGRLQQVHAVVEVQGKLAVNPDGKSVRRLPMEAKAELKYGERFLTPDREHAQVRTIRNYDFAQAKIRIQDSTIEQSLRSERRLVGCRVGEGATLFSLSGPLTREELELIDTAGNSAALDLLVPGKMIAIGETWQPGEAAVAKLLGLEAVAQHDVTATLKKVEDGLAIIDLTGKVSGAVGGVSTEIKLEGKANFHLEERSLTWLAMQYDEQRAIGHAQPGYDATIRVRVQCERASELPQLADPSLSALLAKDQPGQSLLEFEADKAGIELTHDRRWSVMVDRFDTVILRLIDRGDLIAQCNITRLPPLEKGKQLALPEFQQDVERTLKENKAQIVEATQSQMDAGLRILRIVVSGVAAEIPIQWVYYHVSNDRGYRASLVFTMEEKLVERFAQIDRELVENLHLTKSLLDETKVPTPAAGSKSASAKKAKSTTK